MNNCEPLQKPKQAVSQARRPPGAAGAVSPAGRGRSEGFAKFHARKPPRIERRRKGGAGGGGGVSDECTVPVVVVEPFLSETCGSGGRQRPLSRLFRTGREFDSCWVCFSKSFPSLLFSGEHPIQVRVR